MGESKKVLVENKMRDQNVYFGRSENLTPVILNNSGPDDIGKIVNVKIENYNHHSLFGTKQNIKKEVAA